MRRSKKQRGSAQIASKLNSILDKARTFQEIELAVNSSEADSQSVKGFAVQDAHHKAYFEDDLSLCSAEEIKPPKLKEGESLRGTYESRCALSKPYSTATSVCDINTTWAVQERSWQQILEPVSLKARIGLQKASNNRS